MQLTKCIILCSTVITKLCTAGLIIENSNTDGSRLVVTMIDILRSCRYNQISTVGLAGVSAGSVIKTMLFREFITPIILIDDTSKTLDNSSVTPISRYKLQTFLVTVTNSSSVTKTLRQIKKTKWWNHLATFFLLDWSISNHGCSNAHESLLEAWKMNLLYSNFVCLDLTKKRLIYTYNPYTSKAPDPWHLENTYKRKNDHIWSLFVQIYQDDKEICDALNFDKTIDLGGYEIRASVEGLQEWSYPNDKITLYRKYQNTTAQILIDSLNATWKFLLHPATEIRSLDKNGNVQGDILEVVSGISDIGLNVRNKLSLINFTTTWIHGVTSLGIMTQHHGYMSQLDKILLVLDKSSRFGLLLVYLIILLFFVCYLKKPLMSAILNLVVVTCNASLLEIPKKLAPRFYLGSLFLFSLTIQGIYQGKLAALLTNDVRLPNVNNFDDLMRSGYTIYGHKVYQNTFNDSAFEGRFVGLNTFNCTEYVVSDAKAACILIRMKLIAEAANFKLHASHEDIHSIYAVYLIRSDWPLEERVNTIYRRCFDGDLILPLLMRNMNSINNIIELYENEGQDGKFKVIVLQDLYFAFAIFGIGLVCAITSFIIEIGIDRSSLVNLRRSA